MTWTFASLVAMTIGTGTASAAPGDHIRAGDLEFVPNLGLGLQYRSNVYRAEQDVTPAASFGISPGANLGASGDDHDFHFGGEWQLRKYFFVANDQAETPVRNLDRFDEFSLAAGANLFKRNIVGFKLSEQMALKNWTADDELAETPYTSQFRNSLGGGIRINPGPALEFVPGVGWTYDALYVPRDNDQSTTERLINQRNSYGPRLDAKYAFLPRTSLVAHILWTHNDWQDNVIESGVPSAEFGDALELPNSNHVKVSAGIDGRFTTKLFAQLLLGYGVGLYNADSVPGASDPTALDQDAVGLTGLLVTAQVKYQVTPGGADAPGSAITGGYTKDFRDSFFTSFVGSHRLFLEYGGRFADLQPSLRYEVRFEDYHGEVERNDIVNKLGVGVTYHARDWASVGGDVGWLQRASSDTTIEYDDFSISIGANFVY